MSKERFREIMENIKEVMVGRVATTSVTDALSSRDDKLEIDIIELNKDVTSLHRWVTITNNSNAKLKELILNFTHEQIMNNMIVQEELNALMNTPWYKMITKKQRAIVLGNAILRGEEKFKEQQKTLDKN